MIRHRTNIFLAGMLIGVLILALLPVSAMADIESAPARNQLIRVRLTRMEGHDRLDLTLNTSYLLTTPNGTEIHFEPGSMLSFQIKKQTIYLYIENFAQKLGRELLLERTAVTEEKAGFYRTNFPELYLGDLQLSVLEEGLCPILSIHVEDYLLGVVPYEMSDSFPVEALKAQAVAARTYALRNQNQYDHYDVVDNTNDQVFKGYIAGNANAEKAVKETRGVCGFYKGELAQCYYAASNGGQTELVETVWPTKGDYGYYAFGEDPYDLANPESVVRSFELKKRYDNTTAPYALRKLIASKLQSDLLERGKDASPESIRVDSVVAVSVDTPNMYASRKMTMLHLAVNVSVRSRRDVQINVVDQDTEEVSLFSTAEFSITPSPASDTFAPIIMVAPTATPEPVYGPYEKWAETVLIDLPVFTEAEDVFGLDILDHYDNEIWSVAESETDFTIEVRRYGHGVGMSQRGAQWMASEHGKTYQEILNFYYPGMQLMIYPAQSLAAAQVDEALTATAGPAPSPTPRPTPMPLTLKAQVGQWYAAVTEIADDSSLNLRSEPTMNGKIIARLYKGQRLLVMERCLEEGWVHVQTDMLSGYVMERYLTAEDKR